MWALPIYDSIICFGDSLTEQASQPSGFVSSLQDRYRRRLDVVNRGFGGYTSRQAVALLPSLFAKGKSEQGSSARLVTIWLGTNDCIAPGYIQHVPLEEFKKNMTTILKRFSSMDLVLITPATVVPDKFPGHEDDESMVEYGQALYGVAEEVMNDRKAIGDSASIVVLNMNKTFKSAASKVEGGLASMFVEDGLHISTIGYKAVSEAVQETISKHFPHLHSDRLPYVFHPWREIELSADEQGQLKQLQPRRA